MLVHSTMTMNVRGRDFLVGDIHGYHDELMAALKELALDRARDRLICVGDLIDRGPKSMQCLELLREPWFFALGATMRICSSAGS